MKTHWQHMKIWESSLLIALCVTLCAGLWARGEQKSLSKEMVRLHVVADSDSEADQALKLMVRDAILNELSPRLSATEDPQSAQLIIKRSLPQLCKVAEETLKAHGCTDSVSAALVSESFPTRDYDSFSLPAGDYTALRVTIGSGEGHNWWCVVFPPLCMTAAEEKEAFSMLDDEDQKLISGEYNIKFHIIELYYKLRDMLANNK